MSVSADANPIVDVRDLRKVYVKEDKEVEVLRGVTLTIRPAEMVAIMGRSGAGKSTLLHLMGTLDLPTNGTVLIGGRDMTVLDPVRLAAVRNETIGFVFQFHHLLPEFTALENVMMPGLIKGIPYPQLEARARELLKEVSLEHRATHRPSELSGGEQQRVALARALVLDPKIVLADEPTGNLDSESSRQMLDLFTRINKTRGTAMVVVTHSEELAAHIPRVIRMRDGRIENDGLYRTEARPEEPSE